MGAEKCAFAAKEVSYLGHWVTEEGLLPDSALLVAIRVIPPPKTDTEVRSFLGLAGYYRRYVKNFAAIAGPLHALTRKDGVFHWSANCQDTFNRLKMLLTTSPITAFPDFKQAFRLYTDASTAGLGVILAQVREGRERIICCASRSLNQTEKAYPATKLECLAIVWAVAKFRPYLMAMPFEEFTDHYALQWLKTMRTGSALLHRWSVALEEYDFTVKYRLGKAQTQFDRLSRLPVDPAPPEDVLLHICHLENEGEERKLVQELHSATHLSDRHYGSSSATVTTLSLVAAFALKLLRAVTSVSWVAIMATVRRRRGPSSPEGQGIRSQLTLWDLFPPTTDRSSSSCLWTAIRGILSSFPLATTPQTR